VTKHLELAVGEPGRPLAGRHGLQLCKVARGAELGEGNTGGFQL
jgi:hypothetical protein